MAERGIFIRPMSGHNMAKGFIRMTIGTPEQNQLFIRLFGEYVKGSPQAPEAQGAGARRVTKKKYILAHDTGTGGNKAVLCDLKGRVVHSAYRSYGLSYPASGVGRAGPG